MIRTRFYISHRFIFKSAYFVALKNDYSWSGLPTIRHSHHVIRFSTFANNFHSMKILSPWNRFIFFICCPRVGVWPQTDEDFTHARVHDEILCPQDLCKNLCTCFQNWNLFSVKFSGSPGDSILLANRQPEKQTNFHSSTRKKTRSAEYVLHTVAIFN